MNLRSGFVFDTLPGWAPFFRLSIEERIEKLKDPDFRAQLKAGANSEKGLLKFMADWSNMKVAGVFALENKSYEGRLIGEIATAQNRDPFDVFVEVAIADGLRTSLCHNSKPTVLSSIANVRNCGLITVPSLAHLTLAPIST